MECIHWPSCPECGCLIMDGKHICVPLSFAEKMKVTITIDPAVMHRTNEAMKRMTAAMAGLATALASYNRPNERNVIDQEWVWGSR